MQFDLDQVDALLTTTRAVRRRLDLTRPVPDDVLYECLRLAIQAPTGSNTQNWRWLVVRDASKRAALADLYRRAGQGYLTDRVASLEPGTELHKVLDSSLFLAEHLHEVPVMVVPCILGEVDRGGWNAAALFGSILPAMWSFQLALRSRGLGTCLTTLHLTFEAEARDLLEIPDRVTQAGLLPVAYTVGTDFRPAVRRPIEEITYHDTWKAAKA